MARNTGGNRGDVRKSALWGSGNRGGEFRSNALWGKGGRGSVVTLVGVLVLSLAAGAASAGGTAPEPARAVNATVVEPGLLEKAQANPKQKFRIIVQSAAGAKAAETAFGTVESQDDQQLVKDEATADKTSGRPTRRPQARSRSPSRRGTRPSVSVEGREGSCEGLRRTCSRPARRPVRVHRRCLARDSRPAAGEARPDPGPHRHRGRPGRASSTGLPAQARLSSSSCGPTSRASTSSGTGLPPDACDRGRGLRHRHVPARTSPARERQAGQLRQLGQAERGSATVAVTARSSRASPRAARRTTPVLAPNADARLARRHGRQRLRQDERRDRGGRVDLPEPRRRTTSSVANFSLHAAALQPLLARPAEQGGRKLWYSGVVVVAAAGNYGKADGPSGVLYAPGSNPFVITVGAVDIGGTAKTEGRRPRSVVGVRPDSGRLLEAGDLRTRPVHGRSDPDGLYARGAEGDKIMGTGYIELSGTSFAAPVISGIAAQVARPEPEHVTPDQVKGAADAPGPRGAGGGSAVLRRRPGQRGAVGATPPGRAEPERWR